MKGRLAFVLGGGGARGALQAGALRALSEAGYQPDLLVGTSVGAVNAAFLGIHGFSKKSLDLLAETWLKAAEADLLPSNYLWITLRSLLRRYQGDSTNQMRDFFIENGLLPDLCFRDITSMQLIIVAADLNTGKQVLYGQKPSQSILEAVLASTALPPWVKPVEKNGQLLIDGGAVSSLPIEAALRAGASEIIALDLADPHSIVQDGSGFGPFFTKLINTVEQRQVELETALAQAYRVPLLHVRLSADEPVQLWDFNRPKELIQKGYQITRESIVAYRGTTRDGWVEKVKRWFSFPTANNHDKRKR